MVTVAAPSRAAVLRRPGRAGLAGGILAAWVVLGVALRDRWTLALAPADLTALHGWFNDVNDSVGRERDSNPVFTYGFNVVRIAVDGLATALQLLIAQPAGGRPVPVIGWLGVVALVTLLAAALGTLRVALLAAAGLVVIGLQGLWQESMDTLALTLAAVLLSVAVGLPLGIWAGLSDRADRAMTPVLDFLQTMPSFVYLAPLTLLFLIGPASATIVTLVYAVPPLIRYTSHGIRSVPTAAVEAATSLGSTPRQRLVKVQLPMAARMVVLGLNQTIMAALAMVTIAALIDAPGLGITVLNALETLDVGVAFNAGLAIVVLAIVLDRMTTAMSRRAGATTATRIRSRRVLLARRAALGLGVVGTVYAVLLSRTYLWAAEFPTGVSIGDDIARVTSAATDRVTLNASGVTGGIKDAVTLLLIDPLQTLFAATPWFVVAAALLGLAVVLGGPRAAVVTALCIAALLATGVWGDAMTTLASTLVATAVVVLLGVVVGVWMGRSTRVDGALRPVLDAAQVMPAFVYLVPFLALFAASRFTAIVAAVVYAAPVTIKVVADGIRAVPVTTVEAATAAGSSTWQAITKVQLPMARRSIVLAVNQGVCYVLSMVVVGGLVGAGALGYDVVAGFSQGQLFGKGLAAGLAIVLLGIMLNRITAAAAERTR